MVLLVYGFPSKTAALQFEWAWQNPHLSRQAPTATKTVIRGKVARRKSSQIPLTQRVEILREMLGFEGWRRWPLKVAILDKCVGKAWEDIGAKEGIRSVSWKFLGDAVVESDLEQGGSEQDRQRDLNLRKLGTLDLSDGKLPFPE